MIEGLVLLPLALLLLAATADTEGWAAHVQAFHVRHALRLLERRHDHIRLIWSINLVKPGNARSTGSFCYFPSLLQLLQVSTLVHLKPPSGSDCYNTCDSLYMLSCSSVDNGTRTIIQNFSPQSLVTSVFNCFEVTGSHLLPHAASLNCALHVEAIP